jgi:hypothetical protein
MTTVSGSSSVVLAKAANALREALLACRRARVRAVMGCASVGWGHSRVCPGTVRQGVPVEAGLGVVSRVGGSVRTLGGNACPLGVSACTLGGVVSGLGAVVA